MLTSMSSGAILSKTRAMFGRRLTNEDYTVLSQKRDLAGAAAYLGSLPAYRDFLGTRDIGEIHRTEFESILRHRHYKNFESLCRYELSIGEKFSDYILLSTEIELITEALSRVMSPRIEEDTIMTASPFLDRKLKLDLTALGRAQTYDELLSAVKNSVFHDALKQLEWNPTRDLVTYENALLSEFYRRIFKIIDENLSGNSKDTIRDIFISKIDLENLVRVVRLKEYFKGASPEFIRTSLIPHGNVMKNTAVQLAKCKDSAAAIALAETMKPFRKKLDLLQICRRIDELPDRYLLKRCLHEIYFSTHPAVVMISYLYISGIEVANLIKITEGIRYGLSPEQIMNLLILPYKAESAEV